MTKKTSSRLTVQAPRGVSISATTPVVSSEDAQDNGGAAAKLVRRIIENDPGIDYHGIDDFIKD